MFLQEDVHVKEYPGWPQVFEFPQNSRARSAEPCHVDMPAPQVESKAAFARELFRKETDQPDQFARELVLYKTL